MSMNLSATDGRRPATAIAQLSEHGISTAVSRGMWSKSASRRAGSGSSPGRNGRGRYHLEKASMSESPDNTNVGMPRRPNNRRAPRTVTLLPRRITGVGLVSSTFADDRRGIRPPQCRKETRQNVRVNLFPPRSSSPPTVDSAMSHSPLRTLLLPRAARVRRSDRRVVTGSGVGGSPARIEFGGRGPPPRGRSLKRGQRDCLLAYFRPTARRVSMLRPLAPPRREAWGYPRFRRP